jgi:hypothetical protein
MGTLDASLKIGNPVGITTSWGNLIAVKLIGNQGGE